MADLFETPEKLPTEVQEILENFGEVETYDQCKELLNILKSFGYTFDYYLDAVPYDLRHIEPERCKNAKYNSTLDDFICTCSDCNKNPELTVNDIKIGDEVEIIRSRSIWYVTRILGNRVHLSTTKKVYPNSTIETEFVYNLRLVK